MQRIKLAIIGLGNCASALIQGIELYKTEKNESHGLIYKKSGNYLPSDIEVVAAFDIDKRKVGKDVAEAIFSLPNCTKIFYNNIPKNNVIVQMGKVLDSIAPHMKEYAEDHTFLVSDKTEPTKQDIVNILKKSQADILINYLPVGSEKATHFYAECALDAGVGFVNCIPVFIASDPVWNKKFLDKGLPVVGDDIKSQVGATIVHRFLSELLESRGAKILRTYQVNTGGNTDFLNMLDRTRLRSKKKSKTEAVQSILTTRLKDNNIHIGPSDYIPWQKDNKVCFIRIEAEIFGNTPIELELRLSVEDSPNSAAVALDLIRCCKIALDSNQAGAILPVCASLCKHPPKQYADHVAFKLLEEWIQAAVKQPADQPC